MNKLNPIGSKSVGYMNVVRTTTLALGASLIGSTLPTILMNIDLILKFIFNLSLVMTMLGLTVGFMLLLHGVGALQAGFCRALRWYRIRKPSIAILADLPWSAEKGTFAWAWSKMTPNEWYFRLRKKLEERGINAKIKLIKITKPWTRWFLDRHNVILNPYGSVYPEVNIKELTVWRSILHYVLNGGIVVNVADIPFYWAYDPKREIRYELVRYFHQYVPTTYKLEREKAVLMKGKIISFGPYPETPFLQQLRINIINTEFYREGQIIPYFHKLKFKLLNHEELDNVAINRAIVIGEIRRVKRNDGRIETRREIHVKHVESLVEDIQSPDGNFIITPLCRIYFGKGEFITSLLYLEYDKQPEDVKERIIELLCNLMIATLLKK